MELATQPIQPQYATINPYAMLFMLVCLLLTHKKDDTLTYLPILVKMNIMESEAKKQLRSVRKKMKELHPDPFRQTWVGTFDYIYCSYKIVGTVELRCNDTFSFADNNDWLFNDSSNVKDIIAYLSKNRLSEIPGWNSSSIVCKITLNDSHIMRHIFIPHDILNERHSPNIMWEKKLIA